MGNPSRSDLDKALQLAALLEDAGRARARDRTMKIVDLNVLLYAVNASAPQHAAALKWWERTLNGDEQVGLAWPILLGFLRLTTRPGLLPRPLKPRQALRLRFGWHRFRPGVIMSRRG